MPRVTLRERFFPLHQPADLDRFLERYPWSVVFKAGTSDKTVDAVAGVTHRSPQLILFQNGRTLFHLDEFAISPDQLVPLLNEHLPAEVGPPVRNEAVVTLEPYRLLLSKYLHGTMPEERFEWGYLDRLASEAAWRDDETFDVLNSLFENEWGRDVRAARLVAVEFQGQLDGRLEPLKARAARMLERLAGR
jgi:hypothetical protein